MMTNGDIASKTGICGNFELVWSHEEDSFVHAYRREYFSLLTLSCVLCVIFEGRLF